MNEPAPRVGLSTVLLDRAILAAAFRDSLAKLNPRVQFRNPETLGVYAASVFATLMGVAATFGATAGTARAGFLLAIAAWLWLSILLANIAEAIAVEWTKARAAMLRSRGGHSQAKRLVERSRREYRLVDASTLHRGDLVLVEANDVIPADGTVIEGAASVSEAAMTGESAPVLRAPGRELAAVRCGTLVLSDWLIVRVRSREGFFDPIATISEATERSPSPQQIALALVLATATLAFLLAVAPLSDFAHSNSGVLGLSALIALLVCSTPVTTRAGVFVIGIVSLGRQMRANLIATTGGALEAAADVDLLVIDKTGTMTSGDRHAVAFHPAPGIEAAELLEVALLASLSDETPEGRSIVALVTQMPDQFVPGLSDEASVFHEFSAQTRISGVDLEGRKLRKGAADAVRRFSEGAGGSWSSAVSELVDRVARSGATPLVVADGPRLLGVIELHDVLKPGIRELCADLRRMGIRTIMVTGDNALTATAIGAAVGVDEFLGEATPEKKRELIRRCQKEGYRVAMCGDGTNDAPALAQADVAIAMSSGTRAAKEASDLVDLDSDPAKILSIVQTARRMRTTHISVTTFSIAADLAKYLAITPVVFAVTFPALNALNFIHLASPRSAIFATVIFNLAIIVPLLVAAVWGVKAGAQSHTVRSQRRQWIYGLGGMLLPWIGIKLIDMGLRALRLV
ncbi:MAG TPA: potassium-transporting ATPase subunit KdpB [Steroidobacteraceae bacterium]|nr:potassium-transporting ATPase subunit KdpB [Steroidobacteraceae bacterium]